MNHNLTEIVFLLDRSGSMAGFEADTIGGFNAFVKKQIRENGETRITTVLFDDQYEVLWNAVEAKDAQLTEKVYYVRGCTALLDAVGKTIIEVGHRLAQTNELERPEKVIFVITTDGLENASQEFSYERVKQLIQQQTETYMWEFMFLGANMDAIQEAGHLGIQSNRAYNFEASKSGIEDMYILAEEAIIEIRRESKAF